MAATMYNSYLPCRFFSVFMRSPLICAKKSIENTRIVKRGIEEPKRPLAPFLLFLQEKYDHFKQQNPNLKALDKVKKAQGLWKVLPNSEKEKYQRLYKSLNDKYMKDMYLYYQNLSKLKNEISPPVSMKSSVLKAWKKKLGKPSCPLHAFTRFVMDDAQRSGKPFTVPESVIQGKEKWKQLPESEKKKYIEKAKCEWLEYNQKLLEWEKKMVEDGHHLLVRAKSLKMAKTLTAIDA